MLFRSVLTEGDDQQDPIADAARAILDGHIVLSRELAESGHYPAIDVEASISRVITEVVDSEHLRLVQRFRHLYSIYHQNQDLINVGAYTPGADSRIDEAIQLHPHLLAFLTQGMRTPMNWQESVQCLKSLFANHDAENAATQAQPHAMLDPTRA